MMVVDMPEAEGSTGSRRPPPRSDPGKQHAHDARNNRGAPDHGEQGHDVHGHDHDAHGHDAHGHDAHGHDAHGHDAHGHDLHRHTHGVGSWVSRAVFAFGALSVLVGYAIDAIGDQPDWLRELPFALSLLASAWQVLPDAYESIVGRRTLGIPVLVALAAAGAVVLGQTAEAATVAFLFTLGEAIEGFTFARTEATVGSLLEIAPEMALILTADGTTREAPVRSVAIGTRLAVRPGARVPIDAVVIDGRSSVDQAPLTGESLPVDRGPGDDVFAGTLVIDGFLVVETNRAFDDSAVASIVRVAESALTGTTDTQRLIERFARWYTPAVIVVALVVAFGVPIALGDPIGPWFTRALVLVLVACPCALLMAAPVAIVAAVGVASRHGVVVRSAGALEAAGRVDVVAFDKTGTLTHGVLTVTSVRGCNRSEEALLRIASAVEFRSEHPVARAIVDRSDPAVRAEAIDFLAHPGRGVTAVVEGQFTAIGHPSWIATMGVDLAIVETQLAELAAVGNGAVVIAVATSEIPADLHVAGIIGIADRVRREAKDAVRAVRLGREVIMTTGDGQSTALAVATEVGIGREHVYAELLPEEKLHVLTQMRARPGVRAVAMVGDGINDAPALAHADVGIAMGKGSAAIARAVADVTIVADDVRRVGWFLDLARQTRRTIQINVAIALGLKISVLGLAIMGVAGLWLAIVADTGATVLVALNGIRPLLAARR